MKEKNIEKSVCIFIKQCGGVAYKWVSPGRVGVPDRICVMPKGKVIFIETKRPGEKPRPIQEKVHRDLRKLGHRVWVIEDISELRRKLEAEGYEV